MYALTRVRENSTLFAGVPTHMQLTLHLLRTNELYGHPLPPPPPLPTDREVMLALDAAHVEDGDELVSDDDAGIIMDDNDSIDLEEDRQLVDDADSDGEKTKGFKRKLKKAVMKAAGQGRTIGETRQKVWFFFWLATRKKSSALTLFPRSAPVGRRTG